MTRTRTVLQRHAEGPTVLYLTRPRESRRAYELEIPAEVVRDLGDPDVITVTIEQGDLLNV